jgi:ribosomal protein S18 acetylase RimI-like enzyme
MPADNSSGHSAAETPARPDAKTATPALRIQPLLATEDFDGCAAIMASSNPWLRLGFSAQACQSIVKQTEREPWGAWQDNLLVGFVVLNFKGPFVGYVQLLAVADAKRGLGIGAALLAHAEKCIFERTSNVFICVSSFNAGAQRFYARQGYHVAGRLADFLVAGHDELLLRKTRGPLLNSRTAPTQGV